MRLLMLEASSGRQTWVKALALNGINLDSFRLLAEADEAVRQVQYQAIIADRTLPDGCGIDWLSKRRQTDASTPFVVVTASADIEHRVRALNCGIDDAIPESLDSRELVAKLRALCRRQPIARSNKLEAGNLMLDVLLREVAIGGKAIAMPNRELGILEQLLLSFNRTVSKGYLESSIYGIMGDVCPNSIEVRISRLRRYLASSDATVEIATLRGVGYRLQQSQAGTAEQAAVA